MPFELKAWLAQKFARDEPAPPRIPMVPRKVTEPFHAVSIKAGHQACQGVKQFAGIRFLSVKAPSLPLPDCQAPVCRCSYVHHADRRTGEDRRGQRAWQQRTSVGIDRRERKQGRRATDPPWWDTTG
jgi:hypothetical protein